MPTVVADDTLPWLAFGAVLVPVLLVLVGAVVAVPLLTLLRAIKRRLRR